MLSTLAMFVTGVGVLVARRSPAAGAMPVDTEVLGHDIRYFVIAYAIAIGAAFLPLDSVLAQVVIVAVVLIGIYAWYVKATSRPTRRRRDGPRPAPLPPPRSAAYRREPEDPRLRVVNLQVLVALGLIVAGAFFFVDAVQHLATRRPGPGAAGARHRPDRHGAAGEVQCLIWVRQGKDTLSMGNITGRWFPVGDPHGRGAAVRGRALARRRGQPDRVPVGRYRLSGPPRRSSSRWRARIA